MKVKKKILKRILIMVLIFTMAFNATSVSYFQPQEVKAEAATVLAGGSAILLAILVACGVIPKDKGNLASLGASIGSWISKSISSLASSLSSNDFKFYASDSLYDYEAAGDPVEPLSDAFEFCVKSSLAHAAFVLGIGSKVADEEIEAANAERLANNFRIKITNPKTGNIYIAEWVAVAIAAVKAYLDKMTSKLNDIQSEVAHPAQSLAVAGNGTIEKISNAVLEMDTLVPGTANIYASIPYSRKEAFADYCKSGFIVAVYKDTLRIYALAEDTKKLVFTVGYGLTSLSSISSTASSWNEYNLLYAATSNYTTGSIFYESFRVFTNLIKKESQWNDSFYGSTGLNLIYIRVFNYDGAFSFNGEVDDSGNVIDNAPAVVYGEPDTTKEITPDSLYIPDNADDPMTAIENAISGLGDKTDGILEVLSDTYSGYIEDLGGKIETGNQDQVSLLTKILAAFSPITKGIDAVNNKLKALPVIDDLSYLLEGLNLPTMADIATQMEMLAQSIEQDLESSTKIPVQAIENTLTDVGAKIQTSIDDISSSVDDAVAGTAALSPALEALQDIASEIGTKVDAAADQITKAVTVTSSTQMPEQSDQGLNLVDLLVSLFSIIILLLKIFIDCLALIVVVFTVKASPEFLPQEMIDGLNYSKTIEIAGLNITIYDFLQGLLNIIIVFAIIRLMRRNIDKLNIRL